MAPSAVPEVIAFLDETPGFQTVVEGPELRIVMANRRVREAIGLPDLIGKRARDLFPEDNPVLAAMARVYATGESETVEDLRSFYPGSDQTRYYTRHIVALRDHAGRERRVLLLALDVTDSVEARDQLKAVERRSLAEVQRLYSLLEETPMLINVLEGPELRIVMSNRRSRELFGARSMVGTRFGDIVPADNQTLQASQRVLTTGVPETFDVVSRDVEGFAGRSFSHTVLPIRDADGTIGRVMVASLETTEQLRVRSELEAQARALDLARREAVDASRAKDEFLAMLGHELRNPLAPMTTAVELMRLRGIASRELDILARQTRHLTRLVNDLLDVSRIARGLVELERHPIDLGSVVIRALEMTQPLLEQRCHRVRTDISPVTVHGDLDRLAQAVSNLITNAARYSDAGSEIRIGTQRRDTVASLSVADDGTGIAPDLLPKVFDAFFQHPQKLARSHGGLGLGLSIVKNLIEAHGGKAVAFSPGPGKGSTFVIELPAVEAPQASPESPPHEIPVEKPRQPWRVLIVDDNHDAAAILREMLATLGHIVAVAHDGPSALTEAATFNPQLGLLDIGLPVMDGYELAAALRARHPRIRLVAITGYGAPNDRERSRAAGFASHLVKPVSLDELEPVLRERLPNGT